MTDDFAACTFKSNNFPIIHEYLWDATLPLCDCYHEWMNGMTWVITDKPKYFDPTDILWTSIDRYVSDNDISKNKKIVSDYGLFKALKLQNDEYGCIDDILDDEKRFYAILAFNIIREDFELNDDYTKEQYKQIKKDCGINDDDDDDDTDLSNASTDDNDEPIAYRTRSKKLVSF